MILRNLLLFLSTQRNLRRWMETSPVAGRMTRRFVAGQKLEQALRVAEKLNREGIQVALDHLGESVTTAQEAEASRDAYLEALDRIRGLGLEATVSIKLSQFGLEIGERLCRSNVGPVVRRAREAGSRVEIDMEASAYVDRTLALVGEMHAGYGCVRGVIQAYLRRSRQDLESLCELGIPIRLCKGAYKERAEVAFPAKREVNRNFVRLTRILLASGVDPAFATHDPNMVRAALEFADELGVPAARFEFQMLYGIRRDLQRQLTARGCRLRLYVPYGDAWYPYLMRRLAERPANLLFLLRNLPR